MPSLMESLLENAQPDEDWEEFLDRHSIDRYAVSSIEGGFERVECDPYHPVVDDLSNGDFVIDGPPVYETHGYTIVRGFDGNQSMWYVFEPSAVHSV